MAITRPPIRPQTTRVDPQTTDEQARKVISRGGSVAQDLADPPDTESDALKSVQLRLYQSMINDIDMQRRQVKRGKKPSRHAWILSAIEEKLARQEP